MITTKPAVKAKRRKAKKISCSKQYVSILRSDCNFEKLMSDCKRFNIELVDINYYEDYDIEYLDGREAWTPKRIIEFFKSNKRDITCDVYIEKDRRFSDANQYPEKVEYLAFFRLYCKNKCCKRFTSDYPNEIFYAFFDNREEAIMFLGEIRFLNRYASSLEFKE